MIAAAGVGFVLVYATSQDDYSIGSILLDGRVTYCQNMLFFKDLSENEQGNDKIELLKKILKIGTGFTDYKFKDSQLCQDQTLMNSVLSGTLIVQVLLMIFASCQ